MSEYFGSNLKFLREKIGLEQKELIEKIGYKASSVVSEWEAGKRMPNIGTIHDLSKLFNVSIDDLVNKDLSDEPYYLNPETARLAQEAFEDPDTRILMSAKRSLSPESLQAVIDMVKLLRKKENPHLEDWPDDEYPDDFNQVPEDWD